ncbi:FAD-binding domain-containing protein [Melanomma pulvis-pyrius CBS 109.77]|uniref:FAD-binding domain-containing protein n=1 Tax=Melanomma pulvis-pyrius CBS 109.77 TaxID=1314802 RepID=A0A6A6X6D4_9PLEO|nr:FAD-binding domain-containing protein [Melanomma pulvis-pyrius CBS 109.77]
MWVPQATLSLFAFLASRSLARLDGTKIAHDLQSILSPESAVFLLGNSSALIDTTPRFNVWHSPTYTVSVKPAFPRDVQKVVSYSRDKKVPFLATGGGHGYTGTLSALRDGIEVDLSYFNTVEVDKDKNLLKIGGSVRFRDLMGPVYAAGKAVPVGACPCVGMAGATLGGGIGFWSSTYGAISDSLSSLEVITADGSLITVSSTSNADLFWAMKGAGANYGIVTSLTYNIHDAPNGGQVMSADMMFPVSANGSLWEFVKSWVGKQPAELSLTISLLFDPIAGQFIIVTNIIYTGPLTTGHSIIQPLLNLQPLNTNISYIPWSEAPFAATYGGPANNCGKPTIMVPHAVNLYQVDTKALCDAVDYLNQTVPKDPALQSFVFAFTQYSQAGFKATEKKKSAFPWRDVVMYAQMDGIAMKADDVPAIDAFGKGFRDLLQKSNRKSKLEVYTHFAHGDEGAAAWYGEENVSRLRKLKKQYDPQGLFSFYNPV